MFAWGFGLSLLLADYSPRWAVGLALYTGLVVGRYLVEWRIIAGEGTP